MQITNVLGMGLLVALSVATTAQAQFGTESLLSPQVTHAAGSGVITGTQFGTESTMPQLTPAKSDGILVFQEKAIGAGRAHPIAPQEERSLAPAQEERPLVPRSVRLYEANKAALPPSGIVLDICKILARDTGVPRALLPDEVYQDAASHGKAGSTCFVSGGIVAYDFWCTAGMEDPGSDGPHFSRNINAVVRVEYYADGIVIYGNHCKKADVPRTEAGEHAAEAFLERVQAGEHIAYDIRGERFGTFQDTCFPVVKGD